MRFYIKLGLVVLAFVALDRAADACREPLRHARFVLRCGIAEWTGDHRLREQLVYEGRLELRRAAAAHSSEAWNNFELNACETP